MGRVVGELMFPLTIMHKAWSRRSTRDSSEVVETPESNGSLQTPSVEGHGNRPVFSGLGKTKLVDGFSNLNVGTVDTLQVGDDKRHP